MIERADRKKVNTTMATAKATAKTPRFFKDKGKVRNCNYESRAVIV